MSSSRRYARLCAAIAIAITATLAARTLLATQSTPQIAPAPPLFDEPEALANIRRTIAGKEDLPAVEVFKNITHYKGTTLTAGRLLRIMEFGFSRSLGVTCTHCHVAGEWEREDKAAKQIAREMSKMMAALNNDLLKKIPNLKSTNPAVNCTTCHRGQTRPALDLPGAGRAQEPR